MQQLTGLDASFIYAEQPHAPMHIGGFSIMDPSTADGGRVRFKDIIARVVETAHLAPFTRRRLIEVPFNLDFPYWINDAGFDPEFHIRHVALPAPGDWRQLCIQVARIHARPLDRQRPLWEMYVIEGLDKVAGVPPGSFAVLTKIHHACVDGRSATDIGMAISDSGPQMQGKPDPGDWQPDRIPTAQELTLRAQLNTTLFKPGRFMELAARSSRQMQVALRQLERGELKAPPPAPRTRFNRTVSPYRSVDAASFDLAVVRDIKQAANATVNDVMLGISSGAMRRYLLDKQELPDHSLVTQCPINLRAAGEHGSGGNMVGAMAVALRTDIADPRARLLAVCEETRASKQYTHAIGAREMVEASNFVNMGLATEGARVAATQGLANLSQPAFNTVTTNVPGPQVPVYAFGARQVASYGLGCITDGLGLFQLISSYNGQINIGITACREQLPDPAFYAECLHESYAELCQTFAGKGSREPQIACNFI